MQQAQVSNPKDFVVVQFHNSTDFDFVPEMGCMYDSRPVSGISGVLGIKAGEIMTLPYHVGHQLARNLAKAVMVRKAPTVDPAGIPTGVPLWSEDGLESLKNSFLKELYSEIKPIRQSETDILMAKVEELRKMVEQNVPGVKPEPDTPPVGTGDIAQNNEPLKPATYQDKAEVIAELEKRGIAHDKRQGKANLEKLLA